jgi:hypothetical protein
MGAAASLRATSLAAAVLGVLACQTAIRVPISGEIPLEDVPDDRDRQGPALQDYSDLPFPPVASHRVQAFEWLGRGVSEERAPRPEDTFDDGLVVVNPSSFRPRRTVVLAVNIRSSYDRDPQSFAGVFTAVLAVWIDWDHSGSFEASEEAGRAEDKIPFEADGQKFGQALILLPVRVPDSFVPRRVRDAAGRLIGLRQPAIRVRVDYQVNRMPLGPGGEATYGEVEDHDVSPNDLAFHTENEADEGMAGLSSAAVGYARALAGNRLVVARDSREREGREVRGFESVPLAALLEIFAAARAQARRDGASP